MNTRTTLSLAAVLGALAVILGALGAHRLKPILEAADRYEVYQTAVSYHFYHVFALLATGILMQLMPGKKFGMAAGCFIGGTALFSGSLYTLCFVDIGPLGALTPVGGVFLIAGWVLLLVAVVRR
jgi:uncharacterized membrane protein YgdD (TMEM256/DUF423 family)